MGILSKLFDKPAAHVQEEAKQETPAELEADCPHTVLIPRWDNAADMGNNDKATEFVCESCGRSFESGAMPPREALPITDD
jgi:hypothetical protein